MTRPTTEELKTSLQQLLETYNKAVQTQQNCKEAIIATNAVLKDRESEDGDTNDTTSEPTED
tara:strand:- start:42 stop:227 length:186 start_codon:yes stop_codon:yes gene_type:complete